MIVLNERKYAENIIETDAFKSKPYYDLQILARYLYHVEGYRKKRIEKYLLEFIDKHYPPYKANRRTWEDNIERISSKAGKYELVEIDSISITESELQRISEINSKRHRRVIFTMLCLAKLADMKNKKNNGWCNNELKEIFKLARVSATIIQQDFIIGDLGLLGLLEFPKMNGNLSSRVTFIDNNSEIVLRINESDFQELGYVYLQYCGENIIHCQNCGTLIKGNKNGTKKYCSDCAGYKCSETREIVCINCGKRFKDNSTSRRIRCDDCYKAERQRINRENIKKWREKQL